MNGADATSGALRRAPRLIVITDTTLAPIDVIISRVRAVAAAAVPGTVMVQLRDKELGGRQREAFGRALVDICREHGQWFVVNDRLDLASILDADGVHLGEASVTTADARSVLGADVWVSRACHEPLHVGTCGAGADAVLLSPCFAPRKGRDALRVEGVSCASRELHALPSSRRPLLYALGAVNAENAASALRCGADGVAAIGAALRGSAPEPLLRALGICSHD